MAPRPMGPTCWADATSSSEMLGHGGMAEVRKGRDLRLDRPVAVKMLRSDLARDANVPGAVPS